ncbi:hypothetical protein C0992_013033 [Termitomyces sp. T32_za158]|nr:hypothetical protein C0992_013033 [Termitomyces sp. T32_za158]
MSHRPRNAWVHAERDINSSSSPTTDPSSSSSSSSSSTSSTSTSTSTSTSSTDSAAAAAVPTVTSNPTPTPPPSSISQSVFETTSNGQIITLTSFVDAPAATTPGTPSPAPGQTFLENKALSGVVFALVALLGLAAVLALALFAVRRRRNRQLLRDAISFDPASVSGYVAENEKEREKEWDRDSGSGSGSGRDSDRGRSVAGGFGRASAEGGYVRAGAGAGARVDGEAEAAMAYPFGAGHGYGFTERGVRVPVSRQPERAMSPQGQAHDAAGDVVHHPSARGDGIGWTPDPTPFMSTAHYGAGDAGGTNRVLKVCLE